MLTIINESNFVDHVGEYVLCGVYSGKSILRILVGFDKERGKAIVLVPENRHVGAPVNVTKERCLTFIGLQLEASDG